MLGTNRKANAKTGIYFYLTGGELKKFEPTAFSGTSSGGGLLSAVTYGIANSKTKIKCL